MPTVETRSIAIAAAPARVHAYVADPAAIPDWAPDFAERIAPDGEHWTVTAKGASFAVDVLASAEHGTMDIVSATDHARGAFTRVVPAGTGSAWTFTLLFPDGTPRADIDAQMATVEQELERVRLACE